LPIILKVLFIGQHFISTSMLDEVNKLVFIIPAEVLRFVGMYIDTMSNLKYLIVYM
jgi:hypothetical protein